MQREISDIGIPDEAENREPAAKPSPEELEEALFLLRYVSSASGRWAPTGEDATRFAQALAAQGISKAPTLDAKGRRWIGALDALTRFRHPHCVLRHKLQVAAAVAELSGGALQSQAHGLSSILLEASRLLLRTLGKLLSAAVLLASPSFVKRYAG